MHIETRPVASSAYGRVRTRNAVACDAFCLIDITAVIASLVVHQNTLCEGSNLEQVLMRRLRIETYSLGVIYLAK